MRIGYDAKRFFNNKSGLGNYSRSLIKSILQQQKDIKVYLYTPNINEAIDTQFIENNSQVIIKSSTKKQKWFWRSFGIYTDINNDSISIYHGLSNELPFTIKKANCKSVVTIHDVIFKKYPKTYSFINRKIYDYKTKKSCQNADLIIAISENTKKDLVHYYKINPEKIKVIYNSCNDIFFQMQSKELVLKTISKLKLPQEFLLFVSTIEPRKNIELIIKAMALLPFSIPLVIVGKEKKHKKELIKLIAELNLKNNIIWLHNISSSEELQAIYQAASLFIYPSLYEGFGLPIIEAALCKIPILASNSSSLPEAGGKNVLYFNPENENELATCIEHVLEMPIDIKNEMIISNYNYALEHFSPSKHGQEMLMLYNNLIS